MGLTTTELAEIIRECDLYNDHIKLSSYPSSLSNMPDSVFKNKGTLCRRLRTLIQTNNPIYGGNNTLNLFEYRQMQPLNQREGFTFENDDNKYIILILILLIFYFYIV